MRFSTTTTYVTLSLFSLLAASAVVSGKQLFREDAYRKLKEIEDTFSITSYLDKPDSTTRRKLQQHKTRTTAASSASMLVKEHHQQKQGSFRGGAERGYGTAHSVEVKKTAPKEETEPPAHSLGNLCCGVFGAWCSEADLANSDCQNSGENDISVTPDRDSNSVLPASLNGPACPDNKYLATLQVVTAKDSPADAAVYFLNLDDYSTVWAAPLGTLENNTEYVFNDCLDSDACYSLDVFSPSSENTGVALLVDDTLEYMLFLSLVNDDEGAFMDNHTLC